jgi:hypothetical protein
VKPPKSESFSLPPDKGFMNPHYANVEKTQKKLPPAVDFPKIPKTRLFLVK